MALGSFGRFDRGLIVYFLELIMMVQRQKYPNKYSTEITKGCCRAVLGGVGVSRACCGVQGCVVQGVLWSVGMCCGVCRSGWGVQRCVGECRALFEYATACRVCSGVYDCTRGVWHSVQSSTECVGCLTEPMLCAALTKQTEHSRAMHPPPPPQIFLF